MAPFILGNPILHNYIDSTRAPLIVYDFSHTIAGSVVKSPIVYEISHRMGRYMCRENRQ